MIGTLFVGSALVVGAVAEVGVVTAVEVVLEYLFRAALSKAVVMSSGSEDLNSEVPIVTPVANGSANVASTSLVPCTVTRTPMGVSGSWPSSTPPRRGRLALSRSPPWWFFVILF